MTDAPAIPRHAATLVLIRETDDGPRVLMGQRGKGASFMPSKFVFPGGALDPADSGLAAGYAVHPDDDAPLRAKSAPEVEPAALALASLRETWEETGLAIGDPDEAARALSGTVHPDWDGFFVQGLRPATEKLRFIFRAITPPTRHKRFDARFFLASADLVHGDPDDFSKAGGELSHLSWLSLSEARELDLPFITEVVLAEVEARLKAPNEPRPAPFFHHDEGRSYLDHL
ncbi:MAG: DNA mismatch repair protein MutT [Pseudomonadota bacterium]